MDRFSLDLAGRDYCPVRLRGLTFEDDEGCFHAHLPGLDLTGYGGSRRDAKECLEVILREFFKDMLQKGMLEEDLRARGWCFGDDFIWPPLEEKAGIGDMLKLIRNGSAVRGFTCTIDMPFPRAHAS